MNNKIPPYYKYILKNIKKTHKKSKNDMLTIHHVGITDSNTTNIRNSYHDIDDNQGAIVIFTKKSMIDWNKKRCILYGMSDMCKESYLYRLPYELNDIILEYIGHIESIDSYVDIVEFDHHNIKQSMNIITHLPFSDFDNIVNKKIDCYGQWNKLLKPYYPLEKTKEYYVILFEIFQYFKLLKKPLDYKLLTI